MKKIIFAATLAITACQPSITSAPDLEANTSIGAYMIVLGKNYEAKDLAPYAASLPPIYEKYGGHYVAFAPKFNILEGTPDAQAIIISAWPSVEAANSFWTSPEYVEAKKLRDGIGEFDVVILPALPQK